MATGSYTNKSGFMFPFYTVLSAWLEKKIQRERGKIASTRNFTRKPLKEKKSDPSKYYKLKIKFSAVYLDILYNKLEALKSANDTI